MDDPPWQLLSRQTVYQNPWSEVWEDRLVHQASGTPGLYGHFAPVDAVIICAVNAKGELCLVRQWRHAWQQWSWECPCGRIEAGEAPLQAAQRELEEETGHIARQWQGLDPWLPADSRVGGRIYPFFVEQLAASQQQLDQSELGLEMHWLSIEQALTKIQHCPSRLIIHEFLVRQGIKATHKRPAE